MGQIDMFASANDSLERTIQALNTLRVTRMADEFVLQSKIRQCLNEHGIAFQKEFHLGTRNRVDFLVQGGVAIEVKQGLAKPNQTKVVKQLTRYAGFEEVQAIILVVDRNLHLPDEINGKRCISFGLHKRWGIAL